MMDPSRVTDLVTPSPQVQYHPNQNNKAVVIWTLDSGRLHNVILRVQRNMLGYEAFGTPERWTNS